MLRTFGLQQPNVLIKMPFIKTKFPGLLIFEPKVFEDERGYFYESYNEQTFREAGITYTFVQDNQARSAYGVIRGLHFQALPYAQTKLIRAIEGSILDVVVDIRKGSPTYGQSFSLELSLENKKQLLIPRGFAHGYAVLSSTAEVFYKCDALYHKPSEGGIFYKDLALKIDWRIPEDSVILSEKDKVLPLLEDTSTSFVFKE